MFTPERNVRFGRLRASNSHGPISAALPVVFQTEYFNGVDFVLNTDDTAVSPADYGCTALLRSQLFLAGSDTTSDFVVAVGSSTSTGSFSSDAFNVFLLMARRI